MKYKPLIIGYHGCSIDVMDAVLRGEKVLEPSNNSWDWLGSGIYFWEHGHDRALEWARESLKRKRKGVGNAAVLGAVIQLGTCFDLLDVRFTRILPRAFRLLKETLDCAGEELPTNGDQNSEGDVIMRHLDCAVIKFAVGLAEEDAREHGREVLYDSVRGAFEEGAPAFHGACVREKTHIQIAVRNPEVIVGYFRPSVGGSDV